MKPNIQICLVILLATLILSCKNQATAPDAVAYSYGIGEIALPSIIDSTIELIDSCVGMDYKTLLEEYINLDSKAFKLTISKNGKEQTQILDLPTGRTHIENCNQDFIILNSACGGPCFTKEIIFVKEERPNEGYMYCHIAENNYKIISYHVDEEFEVIKIRNLKNSKEISLNISPCENEFSYPCGISKIKVFKDKLLITFDSPEGKPRQKEVSIIEILK